MDELIIRSFQGSLDPDEEPLLQQWRQASLQNERYYRSMKRAWEYAALAAPAAQDAPESPSAVRASRVSARGRSTGPRAPRIAAAAFAAAAMLALGIGIGSQTRGDPLEAEEFVTGRREVATVRLNDGSVVRLAPNTTLRVGGDGEQRIAWLDGHGFFAVAEDRGRMFVVRTPKGDAVVLGTRFDVSVEQDGMQVFVVEGRVEHQTFGHRVELGAMQLSQVRDGEAPRVSRVDDAQPYLSWLGELLVFEASRLSDVAVELERRYGVDVRITNSSVADRTVSAWFSDEPLDQVVLI